MNESSFFDHETHIKDGNIEKTQEKRINQEALNNQREKYVIEAIGEVKNKLTEKNKDKIYFEVIKNLANKHNVDLETIISPAENSNEYEDKMKIHSVKEFFDTYTEEYVMSLIEKELN